MSKGHSNFGDLEESESNYKDSRIAILPVPYEGSVSYGAGAASGPDAIISASPYLEFYDEELCCDTCEIGIHTLPAVDCSGTPGEVMESIRSAALPALRDGKFLASLGGEHSITGPLLEAIIDVRGSDFGVLQLDAHADLRDKYEGTPLSHACIMRRIDDMGLKYSQAGIRSLSREEADFIRKKGSKPFYAHEIINRRREEWIEELVHTLPDRVYITIDLDCFDPSIMPSTGTPEPGGLDWYDVMALIRSVAKKKEIIGLDIVELAPIKGLHGPDFLAAKLLYRSLGYIFRSKNLV